MILENLGTETASTIEIKAAFYEDQNQMYNQETMRVAPIGAGQKRLVALSIDVPVEVSTQLKSQVYLDGVMVNQRESTSRFP
jgi:hypothetical protein